MNNMRAIVTRAVIAASVALCAIVAVPALTFAAPNCNQRRNLVGANLSGCNLTGANLIGANLSDANRFGADVNGANLRGADLTVATLSGANLTLAFRRPGISRIELEGAEGLDTVEGLLD
jgi:uncharacterized protein YjbI with pentapeptide repeats